MFKVIWQEVASPPHHQFCNCVCASNSMHSVSSGRPTLQWTIGQHVTCRPPKVPLVAQTWTTTTIAVQLFGCTRVCISIIAIGSSVFAQLTSVPNTQKTTLRQTSAAIGRIYIQYIGKSLQQRCSQTPHRSCPLANKYENIDRGHVSIYTSMTP